MFALEVELLTGRYVATEYNDRSTAEWPPHPARLFSAMTAAHFDSVEPNRGERAALEWLQSLGAPAILASDASRRDVVTVFVPVNDTTVVGSFVDVAASVEAAEAKINRLEHELLGMDATDRASIEKRLVKAEKVLAAAKTKFAAKVAKNTVLDKVTKSGPLDARGVLPEHRVRQPRSFPSATPNDPVIVFCWRDCDLPDEHETSLHNLVSRVSRLGHSSSLVCVRVRAEVSNVNWIPDEAGERVLRVPRPDQLTLLEDAFERHREIQPRVLPARQQRYTTDARTTGDRLVTSIFEPDWLVLRRVKGPLLPVVAGAGLAATIRRALVRYADDSTDAIPEVLSGHAPDGLPSNRPHLAVVPLPIVGWPKADGSIIGVAIILPRAVEREERIQVYRAVDRWERETEPGDGEAAELVVHLGAAGELLLRRVEGIASQRTLRSETWCRAARIWRTATVIALDRNPGNLRADDPAKRKRAYDEAEDCIRESCARIGLPRPAQVEILPHAPLVGSAKAQRHPRFPQDESRVQRLLTHAAIEFEEAISGPVVIGAGRYVGLGLMRPLEGG